MAEHGCKYLKMQEAEAAAVPVGKKQAAQVNLSVLHEVTHSYWIVGAVAEVEGRQTATRFSLKLRLRNPHYIEG